MKIVCLYFHVALEHILIISNTLVPIFMALKCVVCDYNIRFKTIFTGGLY